MFVLFFLRDLGLPTDLASSGRSSEVWCRRLDACVFFALSFRAAEVILQPGPFQCALLKPPKNQKFHGRAQANHVGWFARLG